jgi:hypothetical protein
MGLLKGFSSTFLPRMLTGSTQFQNADTGAVIDPKAYEAVVDATHRYKGTFYENESSGGAGGYGGADDDSPVTVY